MKKFFFTAILIVFFGQTKAQTFLQHVESKEKGQGIITVTQSEEITKLVNNAKLSIEPKKETTVVVSNAATTSSYKKQEKQQVSSQSATTKPSTTLTPDGNLKYNSSTNETSNLAKPQKEDTSTSASTKTNSTKKGVKAKGYRIQAFSGNTGNDRSEAERIGKAIKKQLPHLSVYINYYSPRWVCRCGNFKTVEEAKEVLQQIKNMGYPEAIIVKGTIVL